MNLTDHIPLPDPARGKVMVYMDHRGRGVSTRWELGQMGFSNWTVIETIVGGTGERAYAMAAELNKRIDVARKLGC